MNLDLFKKKKSSHSSVGYHLLRQRDDKRIQQNVIQTNQISPLCFEVLLLQGVFVNTSCLDLPNPLSQNTGKLKAKTAQLAPI